MEIGTCAVSPEMRARINTVLGDSWDAPEEEQRCRPDGSQPDTASPMQNPLNEESPQG
ncbi:hypothetical protein FrEUN1fDRAFT_7575 [Parafrankia sp. EUN1f]|nr:hypothetical protein FrEUN1fDRAFT_7575 [Parafrankia sp. EUN1f]